MNEAHLNEYPLDRIVSCLFVETDGAYFGIKNVDPWDEARDARNITAMVGGKDKTRISNATPPEFRDLLLMIAATADKTVNSNLPF